MQDSHVSPFSQSKGRGWVDRHHQTIYQPKMHSLSSWDSFNMNNGVLVPIPIYFLDVCKSVMGHLSRQGSSFFFGK